MKAFIKLSNGVDRILYDVPPWTIEARKFTFFEFTLDRQVEVYFGGYRGETPVFLDKVLLDREGVKNEA